MAYKIRISGSGAVATTSAYAYSAPSRDYAMGKNTKRRHCLEGAMDAG
jgi:hypothetical protein